MDEPQIDDPCPQCGSRAGDATHECAGPAPDAEPEGGQPSEDGQTTGGQAAEGDQGTEGDAPTRITIPAGLWGTGLFKTVPVRRPTEPVVSGSLLHRPSDLPGTEESAEEASDAAEGEPTEPTDDADEASVDEATEPTDDADEAPVDEATEPTDDADEAPVDEATEPTGAVEPGHAVDSDEEPRDVGDRSVIDDSLVVPAFLIAAAEGRVDGDDDASAPEDTLTTISPVQTEEEAAPEDVATPQAPALPAILANDAAVAAAQGSGDAEPDSEEATPEESADGLGIDAQQPISVEEPAIPAILANDAAVAAVQGSGDAEPVAAVGTAEEPVEVRTAEEPENAEDAEDEDEESDADADEPAQEPAEEPVTEDAAEEFDGEIDTEEPAEYHPGDPEAARAALLAILYPESSTSADAPESPESSESPENVEAMPLVASPDAPAGSDAPAGPAPLSPLPPRTSLASLRHQDGDDYEDEDEDERPRGRAALIGIGFLVILIAASTGGWFWWQHQQDAPVRDAFATSHGGFIEVVQGLDEATTLEDVAAVGTALGELSDEFEETTAAADGSSTEVAVAARRATLAEREVATAGAYLSELSTDNFSPWLEARGSLTSALEGLDSVSADVAKAGGEADDLPGADLAERVADLIGAEASELAVEKTDMMLADLREAERVADVRAVGTDAAGSADALRTAAAGIGAETDAEELVQHTELHTQLGRLANLRPNNLSRWPGIRDRLVADVAFLPDSGAEAEESIARADKMLGEATKTWETWQRELAEAKEAKEADLEALSEIESTVQSVSTDYAALDSSLGALIRRGDTLESNGPAGDAYARLAGAAQARDRLRNSLSVLDVAESVSDELDAISSALGANADSVRAAAGAASRCADDCVLTDTAGWNDMVRARIGQGTRLDAAVEALAPAVTEAREEITERKMPKRPKI